MKGFGITLGGFEDVAQKEVKELIGKDSKANECVIDFSIDDYEELCKLCYKSQSLFRVLLYLGECDIDKDFEETKKNVKKLLEGIELKEYFGETFKVFCEREGEQEFSSQDLAPFIGGLIQDKTESKANMNNPDVRIYFYMFEDKGWLGIDFAGFDLSKRDYKVFVNSRDINPIVAYSLVREAELNKNDVMLDPFCLSGSVAIEAALYLSNFSPNYYRKDAFAFQKLPFIEEFSLEKWDYEIENVKVYAYDENMPNIRSAKKNAKIAGVNKMISFSRQNVEWLDTKFGEGEVTKIITQLPQISIKVDEKKIIGKYKELLYQSDYILANDGVLCLLAKNPEIEELLENYKVVSEKNLIRGHEDYVLLNVTKA